jgi:small subunit ribosomal protein S27Ae
MSQKWKHYIVGAEGIERKNTPCPRCGSGVFLAAHADRESCGACGYTNWKKEPRTETQKAGPPEPEPQTDPELKTKEEPEPKSGSASEPEPKK